MEKSGVTFVSILCKDLTKISTIHTHMVPPNAHTRNETTFTLLKSKHLNEKVITRNDNSITCITMYMKETLRTYREQTTTRTAVNTRIEREQR